MLDNATIIRYARPHGGMGASIEALDTLLHERFDIRTYQLFWLTYPLSALHSQPSRKGRKFYLPLSTGHEDRSGPSPIRNPFVGGRMSRWLKYLGSLAASLLYNRDLLPLSCRLPVVGDQAKRIRRLVDEFSQALRSILEQNIGRRLLFINHEPDNLESLAVNSLVGLHRIPIGLHHHGGHNDARVVQLALMRARARAVGGVHLEGLERLLGKKALELPEGIDTDAFDPSRVRVGGLTRPLPGSRTALTVVAPGRITRGKGQHLLVEAARMLRARGAPDFQIILVGPVDDPDYRDTLLKSIRISELELNFLILPAQDQPSLAEIYRRADIGVLASFSEGRPRVVMEMASMELPVVATAVGGTSKTMLPGRSGLLVKPGSPEDLAEALMDFLRDENKRRDFGRRGREFVQRHCCVHRLFERHLQFHLKILGA